MELEDYIIWLYLEVERFYEGIVKGGRLRQRGFAPGLSDIEVITIELFGEYQGYGDDKAIWRYMKDHWLAWFPRLSSYKTFAKHCANLMCIKQEMQRQLSSENDADLFLVDGVPIPVCAFARANRHKSFKGVASYGYCAAKKERYFGFKGHMVITPHGDIRAFILTAANQDEREALFDLPASIKGDMIGDKGYLGQAFKAAMAERGLAIHTPLRDNMHDTRPRPFVRAIMNMRRYIETIFAKLIGQFSLASIKARNLWHLSNKIGRKILSYSMALKFHGSTRFCQLSGSES